MAGDQFDKQTDEIRVERIASKPPKLSGRDWLVLTLGLVVLGPCFVANLSTKTSCPGVGAHRAAGVDSRPEEPRASTAEAEDLLATLINLNGMLCAEVISVTPLRTRDRYEVECIEYRGGRHRATYVVDVSRGAVEKL